MKLMKTLISALASLVIIGAIIFIVIKYLDVILRPYYILKQKLEDMRDDIHPIPRVQVEMDEVEAEPSGI